MKITVVTPYDSSNFGAYLQAYCLKAQLEKMGHDVWHVPTRSADYVRNLYYKDKPTRKKDLLFRWSFNKRKEYGMRKHKLFLEDQKVFQVSEDTQGSDVYVLGSDEIWNIKQPAFQKDLFWGIGLTPTLSYAASIGGAGDVLFDEEPKYIEAIRNLKGILVRDVQTKELVETKAGKQAEIVCDPTMLIPVGEYGHEFHDDFISSNQCLLVYAYKVEKEAQKAIKYYAKAHGLKVVSCCFWHDWCDYQCECSPLQFSSLIRQCKAVYTTTFHGTIFSILNHANFVSIPTSPKTNQLLEQFGLMSRLLNEKDVSESSLSHSLNDAAINYAEVECKIASIRKNSIKLLEKALDATCGG